MIKHWYDQKLFLLAKEKITKIKISDHDQENYSNSDQYDNHVFEPDQKSESKIDKYDIMH